MTASDIIILVLIGVCLAAVLISARKNKDSCPHDCSGCAKNCPSKTQNNGMEENDAK